MSSTRSIAVFGHGTVGKPIAEALVKKGAKVSIFSRAASKLKDVPSGAKVFTVDYFDEKALTTIFKDEKVDAVVSTLQLSAFKGSNLQVGIARAAKEAGVKLFVPSEFALSTEGHTDDSLFALKESNAAEIKALGLPTARVITGAFTEFVPFFVTNASKPGEIIITGKGETKFSTTSISDIAGYVAHILTEVPFSVTSNSYLLLEGQCISMREIAALYEKEPTYVSLETVKHEFSKLLLGYIDSGAARSGYDFRNPDASQEEVDKRSGSGNALWPGHEWKQFKDVIPTL